MFAFLGKEEKHGVFSHLNLLCMLHIFIFYFLCV